MSKEDRFDEENVAPEKRSGRLSQRRSSRPDALQEDKPKPFLVHLEEFRAVLLLSLAALAAGIAVTIPIAPQVFRLLRAPLSTITPHPEQFLRSIEITGGFSILMRIVLWSGVLISMPFIAFFSCRFVFPGLTARERRTLLGGMALGSALFVIGVILAYFIALPLALQMMFRIHDWLNIRVEWTIGSYVTFSMRLLFAFGLAFELPVVILVLGYLGIVSSTMLRSKRRHAIVVILVLAAMLTPADIFSLLAMGLPMILLYELCVWAVWMMERREEDRRA